MIFIFLSFLFKNIFNQYISSILFSYKKKRLTDEYARLRHNYMETDDEQSIPEFIFDDLGDGFDDDNDSDNERKVCLGSGCFWRGASNTQRQRFFEYQFDEPWHRGENYVSPIKGGITTKEGVNFNTTICKVLHEGRKSFRLLVAHRDNETASVVVKMMTDDLNVNYINIKVTSTISDNTEGVFAYKYSKPNDLRNYLDDSKNKTNGDLYTQPDDDPVDDPDDDPVDDPDDDPDDDTDDDKKLPYVENKK